MKSLLKVLILPLNLQTGLLIYKSVLLTSIPGMQRLEKGNLDLVSIPRLQ